jgi:hypothetical protein
MNVKIISLFKIFDSQCLLQEPSAMTDGNIGLQSMLSWSRGVWLIVEFRMNSLIWNRGLMMLVFYAFLDVSLYIQGVYAIPAYSFPRQKKVHPKTTHPSIICFHCSPRSIYSFDKILHLHHKSIGHVHLL